MSATLQRADTGPGLDSSLGFRLSRLARRLRHAWAHALAPLELSPPQAAVLRGVADSPGSSLRALARHLDADPMNVKRCVDMLEARGLLASGHDPGDHRPRTLAVTPAGEAVAREVGRLAAVQDARLEGAVPADLTGALHDALGHLEALLGPERPESGDSGIPEQPESGQPGMEPGRSVQSGRARRASGSASPVAGGAR